MIVNPVAGLGGSVGLKGSDGAAIQQKARALGAVPRSINRAGEAVDQLRSVKDSAELITCPGEMGADAVRAGGFEPVITGTINPGPTTPQDTQNAARAMRRLDVSLLLFAGGDGTARDIYRAIGSEIPALGIPAGVKIHSAVFAKNPGSAGELAALFLQGKATGLQEAEVMDIDEDAFRQGCVSAKLYGYLNIPFHSRLVPGAKNAGPPGTQAVLQAIAAAVVDKMETDCLYLIGPGTTTRAITDRLGLPKTLLGVDVVMNGKLAAADVNEAQLLDLLAQGRKARIIVTPIGGQGYILGRGNQQFSPGVIKKVGAENLMVVSVPEKIHALGGRPLWVDTGDRAVDKLLSGYIRVVTGFNEQIVYRVSD